MRTSPRKQSHTGFGSDISPRGTPLADEISPDDAPGFVSRDVKDLLGLTQYQVRKWTP